MKILRLEAENIKRLVAVSITPEGAVVELTGENGQGKTSVLDAIWWALTGKEHIQSQPIRNGEDKAVIRLDLGEYKVTRRFSRSKEGAAEPFTTSLIVENADGARYQSPQGILESLVEGLAFDPLAFMDMDPKAQMNALRRFVPDVDFDAIAEANKADYASRTQVNREARDAWAAYAQIKVPEDLPTEPIDETRIIDRLDEVGEKVRVRGEEERRRERFVSETDRARRSQAEEEGTLEAINEQIARLQREKVEVEQRIADGAELIKEREGVAAGWPELPEVPDSTAIRRELDEARATNRLIQQAETRAAHKAKAEDAEKRAQNLTDAMAKRDREKAEAIAKATMPVEGLAFGDGEVLYEGVPLDQAADAVQLRVSIAIAAAMNPKLRVIRVRDGSRLSAKSFGLLGDFAEHNDLQVWIETVESGRPSALVIEDGRVQGAEPEAEAAS